MQSTRLTFAYPLQPHPRWGEPFVLMGKLTTALGEPVVGATIYLQSLRNYGFKVCTPDNGQEIFTLMSAHVVPQWVDEIELRTQEVPLTAQTNMFGSYYFSVNELTPGINQYRMRFLGDNSHYESVSNPETVSIRKWHTTLRWGFKGCPEGLTGEYQNYTLKGRLFFSDGMPSTDDLHLNGVPITIRKVQTWPAGVKHDIKTTTDKNGFFEIRQNDGRGTYAYTAEFDGNEYFNPSASGECIVRIS